MVTSNAQVPKIALATIAKIQEPVKITSKKSTLIFLTLSKELSFLIQVLSGTGVTR